MQVGPAGGGGGAQRATAARGKGADESAERAEGAGSPTLQTPGRTFLLRPAHRLAPARSVGHRLLAGPRRRQGWPWGTAGGRGWAWRRRRRVRAACPASPPCPAVPPPGSRPRSPTAARRAGRGAGVQRHAAGDVPGGDDQGHQRHQRARRQGPPAASPARSAARPPSRHPCPPPPPPLVPPPSGQPLARAGRCVEAAGADPRTRGRIMRTDLAMKDSSRGDRGGGGGGGKGGTSRLRGGTGSVDGDGGEADRLGVGDGDGRERLRAQLCAVLTYSTSTRLLIHPL